VYPAAYAGRPPCAVPKKAQNRLHDDAAPGVAEAHVRQLRERGEEVLGEQRERRRPSFQLGSDRAAEVVDRVVAAPHDPVVGGQPIVVVPPGG
jgi:hypothetical protein